MNKLLYWFSISTIFAAVCLICYAGYLLFYPFKPFAVNKVPVEVLTKKVVAGQDLIYKVDYCRQGTGSGVVTRTIVGDTFIPTPVVETISKEGCSVATIHLPVPAGSTPGTYHLEVSAEFHPNALRSIVVKFNSEDFQIVAPAPGSSTTTVNTSTTTNTTTVNSPVVTPPSPVTPAPPSSSPATDNSHKNCLPLIGCLN